MTAFRKEDHKRQRAADPSGSFSKSQLSLRRRWVEPHRIRPSALAHRRSAPAPPARFLRGGGFRITSARGGGRGPSARPPTKRLGLRNGCQARAGFVLLTSETLLWVMKVGHCHKKEIRQSKRISGQYFGDRDVDNPDHYPNPTVDRCAADLAVQFWMGLLSRRRAWHYSDHRHHPGAHRTYLKSSGEPAGRGGRPRASCCLVAESARFRRWFCPTICARATPRPVSVVVSAISA